MKKQVVYNISKEQIYYIEEYTFTIVYGNTLYWLYSERMPMLLPFLSQKKKDNVSLEEMLEYCKNQQIQIYPMTFRKRKLMTSIASYFELLDMRRRGLLIRSGFLAKLIIEYSKYCIARYPMHIR
ncbi:MULTISPECIES: hypothetical protein [unclassified Butyrivibrio]|uniref:hypothetical protein n=1 Tax=unclassified Butyrivibrio TaxID=2639466 RepID=UPI0004097522|nr:MULTISPECIES: hypothetical protein [unclassified Butyrivibrio]